ncbi:very-short-patch-repair endonuclease [Pseudarthrobacter defluvii]|uniref:type IV toxin-antitoxin system AbiEi family antitoxin domain-containing protein n=1 Tax=Pseudarthrobacter defluvii TaxID=410837 RepID=UPI00277DBA7F|nr:type IV toxin-antitoxin system AbiEi family antitoxin domain-containing protein [Pseudarthrobacter defluvii]MDQ0768253.1 very-short-patch-repair endonuclease [Pseudarthrobacter defluvii]
MKRDEVRALVDDRWPEQAVASTRQLAAAGLDDRVVAAAVKSRALLRLRRGAYVRSMHWHSLKPWDRDHLHLVAHFESTHGRARYSHVSGALLHGFFVFGSVSAVHVTTSYSNSRASAAKNVRTHKLPLTQAELASLWTPDGREIFTTSPERTVLDCARILPLDNAAVIGDHALRKGASMEAMRQLLNDSGVTRGGRRALDLLNVLDGRSESAGETRTRLLLHSLGLRMFEPQVEIPTREGLFRADFADPGSRVIIEFDGAAKYTDYKPTADVLLAERRRENALQELGWTFFRINWKALDRPGELQQRLFAFLAQQKRPRPV